MEDKNFIFADFQHISNKLKKRRMLKKPNVTEACQQFENLAVICEEDLPQYAGLCYQAAANCQVSLGNTLEQAYLLIKAFRQYMSNYLRYVTQRLVYTDENYHEALVCYKECIDCYDNSNEIPNKNVVLSGISLEMADVLKSKLGRFEESVDEYKNALKLLDKFPVEKIYCLQKLILTKIEMENYGDALKYTNDLIEEAQKIPTSGFKEDALHNSEITRILLLLILQPTPQQITPMLTSVLEKYAWVETVDNNELADLQTTLSNNGVSVDEKFFLCIQSLVMACQYGDRDCLVTLESELIPYITCEQRELLRILVKQKLKK